MKSRLSLVLLVIFGLLASSGRADARPSKKVPPLALGGHKIGETLDDFKASFPTSACGKAVGVVVNRHTLIDPGHSRDITCCVDDELSLAKVSKRIKIVRLFLDQCELLAGFHNKHLTSMSYMIEASSIEAVLPDFVPQYGPPHDKHSVDDVEHRIGAATWIYGDDFLELTIITGANHVYDPHLSHTKPFLTVHYVDVELFTVNMSLLK